MRKIIGGNDIDQFHRCYKKTGIQAKPNIPVEKITFQPDYKITRSADQRFIFDAMRTGVAKAFLFVFFIL